MDTFYRKTQLNGIVLLAALIMVSCSTKLSYQDAMNKNDRKITDVEKQNDARFLVDARSSNLLEMKMAEAAMKQGYAAAVVEMARRHFQHHEDLEDDLKTLARKEKIALPYSMSEIHQGYLQTLINTNQEDFDSKYLETLDMVNEENRAKYMTMATDAKDADVRMFAAEKLDLISDHAKKLDEVEQKLLNTY